MRENNKIALIVNTISKNSDVWSPFFDRLVKHTPEDVFDNKYVFVDNDKGELPDSFTILKYSTADLYRSQFLSCIREVEEEYCIYISEDYILYDNVRGDLILNYREFMNEHRYLSFIRFMKGGVVNLRYPPYKGRKDLFKLHNAFPYFYTNQAALWRTRDLELIHEKGPELHIANKDYENSFEWQATKTCQDLEIQGLFCYHGEEKRGMYHYDSKVFPHISTALVKGKWNINEYPNEMTSLIKQYNIDIAKRGWV